MKQDQKKEISSCCKAPIIVVGGDEGTNYYECTKCKNACNPLPELSACCDMCMKLSTDVLGCSDCLCHKSQPQSQDWEELINEAIRVAFLNYGLKKSAKTGLKNNLLSIISKVEAEGYKEGQKNPDINVAAVYGYEAGRQSTISEIERVVEGMKREVEYGTPELEQQYTDIGFNQALSDLSAKLSELKKEK